MTLNICDADENNQSSYLVIYFRKCCWMEIFNSWIFKSTELKMFEYLKKYLMLVESDFECLEESLSVRSSYDSSRVRIWSIRDFLFSRKTFLHMSLHLEKIIAVLIKIIYDLVYMSFITYPRFNNYLSEVLYSEHNN